jgi:tRNA(Ile)-lysidine synthase
VAAVCREAGENLEQAARDARLDFFRGLIETATVDRVATGHTRSDQAETVLFRLLRGAGTAGLAGIRPVTNDGIVRPLLEVDRVEVEQFLRDRGFSWRDDSSNASSAFARNRIRHALLPQLTADWNPAMAETLAHLADWAQAEESYWDAELARLAPSYLKMEPPAVLLGTDALGALPLAAARRLVRYAVEAAKGDLHGIGYGHLAGVLELAPDPRAGYLPLLRLAAHRPANRRQSGKSQLPPAAAGAGLRPRARRASRTTNGTI